MIVKAELPPILTTGLIIPIPKKNCGSPMNQPSPARQHRKMLEKEYNFRPLSPSDETKADSPCAILRNKFRLDESRSRTPDSSAFSTLQNT